MRPKKRVTITPLAVGDIAELARNLRDGDRAEVYAALGQQGDADVVFRAIADSVLQSTHTWTGKVNGELACMFGVGPVTMLTGTGRPWLLATPLFDRNPSSIARHMRTYLGRMLQEFPHLENWVLAENTRAVGWLAKLGFKIYPPAPWGATGEPFHRFEMEAR